MKLINLTNLMRDALRKSLLKNSHDENFLLVVSFYGQYGFEDRKM